MNLSGNNTLSISEQTGASFLVNLSLDNINGLCDLGFTGVNQSINFKFTNGKIFDPENKLVYTYNANENIKLSGNINTSGYDYYINDYYLSNISSKSYTKFDRFYFNTSGCTGITELYINGDRPNYKLDFNNFYYVRENITGFISGNQNLNFKIYSGDIISPANSSFSINTIPSFNQNISGQKYNIIVTPDFDTTQQLYLDKSGDFIFGLYTNFGKISGVFKLNSQYFATGYINYFDVNKISETFSTEPGQTNTDFYVLGADFVLGNETGAYSIDKNLSFIFEYASGYTGTISQDININTGINATLTGFISGSGYLSNSISATGSGINLLNNQIVTGLITNNVSGFIYLNGFVINDVNILGSGIKKMQGNQIAKITGNDAEATDFFGYSVSLNSAGNVALVGAIQEDPNGVVNAGSAYIFTGSGNSWIQVAKITGSDGQAGDNFGYSTSLNSAGNIALIGAVLEAPNEINEAGSAYIFTGSGNSWVQTAKITGNDAGVSDFFGRSVSLNSEGNVALIGAIFEDPNGVDGAGAAYIFTGSGNSWIQTAKITGNNAEDSDFFGNSVSLNSAGNIALIGAVFQDPNGVVNAGSAYIFTGSGNSWIQVAKITGSDGQAGDNFGHRTSLNSAGNVALVGAWNEDPNGINAAGSAYVFTGSGNSWIQVAKITGSDGQAGDNFGWSVSLNSGGNVALIGAYSEDPNGINAAGSAYIFTGSGNSWVQTAKITGNDAGGFDGFGFSVSLNSIGNVALIGASNEDPNEVNNAGSAYIFNINDKLVYANVTGKISGFSEAGVLPYDDNIINIIDNTSYTGYLPSIIATGTTNLTENFTLTGKTTINYQKTFTGTLNIITGYSYQDPSGNLIPTGNINFRSGNYITNGKYTSGSFVPSNINEINISIEKTNFYDNYAMSGNLYITGRNITNNLVTGIKIPIIITGVNAPP
jgi:hypothetical protein